eukprot:3728145-Pyramimonas_sp.AAC.1
MTTWRPHAAVCGVQNLDSRAALVDIRWAHDGPRQPREGSDRRPRKPELAPRVFQENPEAL